MTRTQLVVMMFLLALVMGFSMKYFPSREGFMQKEVGMPLDGPSMSPYDSQNGSGWKTMPVGSLPQNIALEQNKLMFLVDTPSSPSCCPGSGGFSDDSGCLCVRESDKALMNTRGGNR